jgi:hypothetical protein
MAIALGRLLQIHELMRCHLGRHWIETKVQLRLVLGLCSMATMAATFKPAGTSFSKILIPASARPLRNGNGGGKAVIKTRTRFGPKRSICLCSLRWSVLSFAQKCARWLRQPRAERAAQKSGGTFTMQTKFWFYTFSVIPEASQVVLQGRHVVVEKSIPERRRRRRVFQRDSRSRRAPGFCPNRTILGKYTHEYTHIHIYRAHYH